MNLFLNVTHNITSQNTDLSSWITLYKIRFCNLFLYSVTKQKRSRPWGFQAVEASTFKDNRHTKLARLSALCTGRLYPPRKYFWSLFVLEADSTQVQWAWKIPMTPSGIEPATSRLVAQCLNQLLTTLVIERRMKGWLWVMNCVARSGYCLF